MNKIICIIFTIILCFETCFCSGFLREQREIPKSEYTKAACKLEQFDVVRNPLKKWNEGDFIKRRDVFQIAYITKANRRSFYFDETQMIEQFRQSTELIYNVISLDFIDVENNTYDWYLLHSLLAYSLIRGNIYTGQSETDLAYGRVHGNIENNIVSADFDAYTTYYQALAIIGRLFEDGPGYSYAYWTADFSTDYPYYRFAERIGLINNQNEMDVYSPKITVEQLNENITAHEFMYLLYKAMYIPFSYIGDFESGTTYFAERLSGGLYADKSINSYIAD